MGITSDVSCRILELDFAGIEAVLTGYFLHRHIADPGARAYIRLAQLGMHAAVTARAVGKPANLAWPDAQLKSYLDSVKKGYPTEYDLSKRTVHAKNFGMSVYGQVEKFPEYFPTIKRAQEFEDYYFDLAPGLPVWHAALRKQAHTTGKLGGPTVPGMQPTIWTHPYGYQHWFWDVLSYQPTDEYTARKWLMDKRLKSRIVYLHGRPFKVRFGNDGNRVIANYPQSTAAGRLKEAEIDLFCDPDSDDYIGDCYFGRTPLLGPIHDSLVLHIPNRCFDRVLEITSRVMQRPSQYLPIPAEWHLGPNLAIGIAAKAGRNWAPRLTADDIIKLQTKAAANGQPIPQLRPNATGMEDIEFPRLAPWAGEDPALLPRDADQEGLAEWKMLQRTVA